MTVVLTTAGSLQTIPAVCPGFKGLGIGTVSFLPSNALLAEWTEYPGVGTVHRLTFIYSFWVECNCTSPYIGFV
jgi:hypothetical protein